MPSRSKTDAIAAKEELKPNDELLKNVKKPIQELAILNLKPTAIVLILLLTGCSSPPERTSHVLKREAYWDVEQVDWENRYGRGKMGFRVSYEKKW